MDAQSRHSRWQGRDPQEKAKDRVVVAGIPGGGDRNKGIQTTSSQHSAQQCLGSSVSLVFP
jgi:hypothetical protein